VRILVPALALAASCFAQPGWYVAALGGIATLSGDTRTPSSGPVAVAFYEPENSAAWNLAAGRHLNDWFSVQANYIGNRNRLRWTYFGDNLRVELPYRTRQHAGVADLLLYFRDRRSWVRPYLSAGVGAARTTAELRSPQLEGQETSTGALLRVAVGIDVLLKSNLRFRYSFSESISANPFAGPVPSKKAFMNFQNLFGAAWYF
jgi:hypothetical protein